MRNRKISTMNKEKIVMIASSLLVVTACTLTGVYINGREKTNERQNVVDFTQLEAGDETASAKNENTIPKETKPSTEQVVQPINNSFIDRDLDVDPTYRETGSSSIINPEFPDNAATTVEDREKEEDEKPSEDKETSPEGVEDEEKTPEDEKESQKETKESPASETMSQAGSAFGEAEKLAWPVQGDVLMNYSMDKTVYFATLNQYKYNPALIIKSEPKTEVKAPYAGTVKEVGNRAEIGGYAILDLGNGYELTVGQLENLTVQKGSKVSKEQVIGNTAQPSKYYSVEGSNIYLKLTKDGNSINPMDFLNS